jgi:Zn-dependent protease with chaperone function
VPKRAAATRVNCIFLKNKDALAFIIGHELGHLRLGHTRLWYQLSTAYVDRVLQLKGFSRGPESSPATGGVVTAES